MDEPQHSEHLPPKSTWLVVAIVSSDGMNRAFLRLNLKATVISVLLAVLAYWVELVR